MRQKTGTPKPSAEKIIKDIRRGTRKHYGAEEKIRIVRTAFAARIQSSRYAGARGALDKKQP